MRPAAYALLLALLLAGGAASARAQGGGALNVRGGALQKCSGRGMALTGFTREGACETHAADAGSHHVCIDMASATGGNFCEVTGQPNWCSSSMACDGEPALQCPIEHWCVCQWAFASYVQKAGCDNIQNVVCDATNLYALEQYQKRAAGDHRIALALECLESRCGLQSTVARM